MMQAIRQRVRVKTGGVIEVRSPELKAGDEAEVIVMVDGKTEAEHTLEKEDENLKRSAINRLRRAAGRMGDGEAPFDLEEITKGIREGREK